VAEAADAWITYGDTTYEDLSANGTLRIVAEQAKRIEQRCSEIGREFADIQRIYLVGNTEAAPLTSIEHFTSSTGTQSLDLPIWYSTILA
jgi:hypothetical protein